MVKHLSLGQVSVYIESMHDRIVESDVWISFQGYGAMSKYYIASQGETCVTFNS